jgi:hypothetical protein
MISNANMMIETTESTASPCSERSELLRNAWNPATVPPREMTAQNIDLIKLVSSPSVEYLRNISLPRAK